MADGGLGEARIARLRERWQADPSSRLFLQLAEEYRRTGQMDEAIAVLEKGLQHHPNYLSAKVALARCHLETGKPQQAAEVLRVVVEQDPTQLVANKLLVEAYVAMDEDQLAGKALDAYMALNRSDPEIEQLDHRIEAMRSDEQENLEESPESAPFEVGMEEGEGAGDQEDEDQHLGREAEVPTAISPPNERAVVSMRALEPFPGLYAHRARHRWMRALSAPGLFPVVASNGSNAPAAIADTEVFQRAEPASEPEVGSVVAAPEPQVLPIAGEAEEVERPDTVTLGRLYLEQGHPSDAAAIFRRVIDRDPANVVALEGLAEAERRLQPVEESVLPEPRSQDGLNARKIRHLQEYLARLRRGSGDDVS